MIYLKFKNLREIRGIGKTTSNSETNSSYHKQCKMEVILNFKRIINITDIS